ncbi:apolipoprotein N-acyltransferase [Schaalia sp. lx-260]|uniref:apolipoprotein N-acyltransferase n=1 Tax=Schaalia sp. lx-260 TaxID=2899082 RepID=UPI001E42F35E|nr:apolipoprotein N-acyltransferase [Schaalia sp. lx-260]MCD4549427.1 apolipoprotein N-acyltransferase [Schaalia sp. lx-260]
MVSTVKERHHLLYFLFDLICACGAGAALWAAFPDVGAWWSIPFALALVIARLDHAGAGRAFIIGAIFGSAFWFPHITWAIPATGSYLPWCALALAQVFFFALWGCSVSLLRVWKWARSVYGQAVTVAVMWVGIEQFRSHWPWSGFPWGNLAYPQVDGPLGHIAPFVGEVGVSFIVVFSAVLLRRSVAFRADDDKRAWWGRPVTLLCACILLGGPYVFPLPLSQENGAVNVGVVQGNVRLPGAYTYAIEGKVSGDHADEHRLLGREVSDLDFIVWGENSLDRDPRVSSVVHSLTAHAVDTVGVPTLVGLPEYREDHRWNWVGMWYPHSGLSSSLYGKQIPVPFGEFIPFRSFVSRLATEAAQVEVDLLPVQNAAYLEAQLSDGRLLPMTVGICFEVAYESLLAQGVRQGGQIIVIPTNNYHFLTSPESAQQGQILRFRAMEFSRSAIQASTTGESMLIRPNGTVQAVSSRMVSAHIAGELPLRSSITFAARYCDEVMMGALISAAVLCGSACITSLISRGKKRRAL